MNVAGGPEFTHFDETGAARMVDVGAKSPTPRVAIARGEVRMRPETLSRILEGPVAGDGPSKGNVLETARLAGILGGKRTAELIPLCHPVGLDRLDLAFRPRDEHTLEIEAVAAVVAKTGVEMEALTAVSVAALTLYDMCKAVDRDMVLGRIRLIEKRGGKTGLWRRSDEAGGAGSPPSPEPSSTGSSSPGSSTPADHRPQPDTTS